MNRYIYWVLILVALCALTLPAQDIPSSLKEIEELYNKGSHGAALEQSQMLLNNASDRLTQSQKAFLYYYIALGFKKDQNIGKSVEFLKKLTLEHPTSDYSKTAYLELADTFKDDYFQWESYLVKLFKIFPQTPEAVRAGIELSQSYLKLKNYQKALPVMETIVNNWQKGAQNPELYMLLAVGYSGINDYIEAIDYVRRAEKTIKAVIESNPLYLFEAGKILHNNLNFKRGIYYLERLFNVFPNYKDIPEASILLAQCYEREKKNFLSAVFLIKAIDKKPPQKHIHTLFLNLGRTLGKLDNPELKKIKQNYPLYADAKKLLTYVKKNSLDFDQRRTAAILLSDELKKNNNLEQVLDNYYKFLADKRDPLVEKLFKKSLDNYLYDLEKKQDHQAVFQAWVKLKDRKSYLSGPNLLKFGQILYQMELFSNAQEIYHHLLKYKMYSQYWQPARKQLIRTSFKLGQYEECLQHLHRLDLDKPREKNEFNYYRLFAYQNLKKETELNTLLDSGAADFNKITSTFQYRTAQLRATQLETQKKYNEALEIYQRMLAFNQVSQEDEGRMMAAIANLYYRLKDLESSLSYYRLAEKYNTNQEWILFRITGILRDLNKRPEAEKELEKLRKINPASFWVKQLEKDVR